MDWETYMNNEPFSVSQADKDTVFREKIQSLTEHHRKSCRNYDDICNGLSQDGPYLPVALFKNLELCSVPEEDIVKRVTSSGTTGQEVSKIYLDANTAAMQQRALCMITGDFIGGSRMPMLIIDSPDVLRDRRKFSARGAGILGFSMMASKRYYALDENMNLDMESIRAFEEKAKEGPTFAFGFTFMIWAYFYKALKQAGAKVNLNGCHLIHGGGWKKLQNQSVSNSVFKEELKNTCGIERVSDYYGMAEQTGSIFMECEEGHLHASKYSEISILNPVDFSPCGIGEWGLIALDSFLPESYPGHRLLTEDWGRLLGEDDCSCGRKGRYFEIKGRIKKAEIRGCSDTFAKTVENVSDSAENDENEIKLLAGTFPAEDIKTENFNEKTLSFIQELSEVFTKRPEFRQYPEVYSLGFWCRKSHIEQIRKRQQRKSCGRGLVLHITPSNMPAMFAYSWITALLAGCSNVVRLSGRDAEISDVILRGIREVMDKPEYESIKKSNAFIKFPRDHRVLEELSMKAAARIIWGGDETVRTICGIEKAHYCTDITFPDKYSIAVLYADDICDLDEDQLKVQAHLFYNDTYGADQNACSSPRTVFWVRGKNSERTALGKERWWKAIGQEAAGYDLQPWMATEKYRMLCVAYARREGLLPAYMPDNRLYVVPCREIKGSLAEYDGKMGMFFEMEIDGPEEIFPLLEEKIQTVVTSRTGTADLYEKIRAGGCPGVDRVVGMGEALNFDTVWDRKDIIDILSE